MSDKADDIKELLCLEDVHIGRLELYPEYGFGDGIIGVNYCLYKDGFEKDNEAYNERLGFPFNIEKVRPPEGRIKLNKGDRLLVYCKKGLNVEKEIILDSDGAIGFSDNSLTSKATESDFHLWVTEERKAKLFRKKSG
jgi:hypothetical protein